MVLSSVLKFENAVQISAIKHRLLLPSFSESQKKNAFEFPAFNPLFGNVAIWQH
jgi:hypothetical protein